VTTKSPDVYSGDRKARGSAADRETNGMLRQSFEGTDLSVASQAY